MFFPANRKVAAPKAIFACSHGLQETPCTLEHPEPVIAGAAGATVVGAKPSEQQVGGRHYKDFVIQPAEFIHKNEIGFLEGNVIKYVCRHSAKNGKADLLKAKHYIDLLLEWEYPE